MSSTTRQGNRLAHEASAYLRQHAQNPVDWFPWGPEALEKARREDKPILLSIGYSACHWCHVMERESFEDEATARVMNDHFVSIKVDREERPDLDHLYQTVVQLLRQSGGWPLTVFLTPEQRPFYAGTYFPPEPRHGMPAFRDLLVAVSDAYGKKREDVGLQADEVTRALAEVAHASRGGGGEPLRPDLLARAAQALSRRFDDEHGGFGTRPKFPNTMGVEVLLRTAVEDSDAQAEARVRRALDGMRRGGIWDQLGGGFHRYSTDERWLVPHFEKMLYDNAQLLKLYLDAGRALAEPGYREVASAIARYLLREMQSPEGGFYATQDADSEGEEGRFFVWTPAEIDGVMGDAVSAQIVKAHFGVSAEGNFERSGATVLSEAAPLDRVSIRLGLPPSEVRERLEQGREALFQARERRVRPFRDEKMLACWNGLLLGPLAELGAVSGDPSLVGAAEKAFAHLEARLVRGGRVARFVAHPAGAPPEGVVREPGFLDDHANMALAALDLYEVTGRARYVEAARAIAAEILARFVDPEGGFFFTASDGEPLILRMRDAHDQATPAGAAVAALVLLRLASLVGGPYAAPAERYLTQVAAAAADNPFGLGQTLCALDRLVRGSVDVVIVGDPASPEARALHREALEAYLPNRTLALVDPSDPASIAAACALTEGRAAPGEEPRAYVCRGTTCSLPVRTPAELRALLAAPRG